MGLALTRSRAFSRERASSLPRSDSSPVRLRVLFIPRNFGGLRIGSALVFP